MKSPTMEENLELMKILFQADVVDFNPSNLLDPYSLKYGLHKKLCQYKPTYGYDSKATSELYRIVLEDENQYQYLAKESIHHIIYYLVRAERFCSGTIARAIRNKSLMNLIIRYYYILKEESQYA